MPKNSTSVFEGTAQVFPSIMGVFNIVSLPKDYLLPTSTTVGTGTLYRLNSLTIGNYYLPDSQSLQQYMNSSNLGYLNFKL